MFYKLPNKITNPEIMSNTNKKQTVSPPPSVGMLGHMMLSEEEMKELLGEGNFDEPLRDDE